MRPSELQPFLREMIRARLPTMLVGSPGVGKTEIVQQVAESLDHDLITSHPVVSDPTDAKGLPWPAHDGKTARFLPFGDLSRALTSTVPTVWFLDDLGQASPATQASFMQLLLARKINDHHLPEHITFIAATNRRTDRAGVSGILEPVKSRFASIVPVDVDLDDWVAWAMANGIRSEIIAYLRYRPDNLNDFKPTGEMTQSPSPRTWSRASHILSLEIPNNLQHKALKGAVGEGAATEFIGFLRMYETLPTIDSILNDPKNGPVPEDQAQLYAVATALGSKATPENMGAVGIYADRLREHGHGEFAVLIIRDAVRRDKKIYHTPAFREAISGGLEDLIKGEGFTLED